MIFYLKDESDLVADVPGSRAEQRRRYWTYALPVIKQAQSDDGIFHNVNPTSENWINGYFGMRGVSICCVANSKGARVELYLQRNEKAENKKLYDILVSHKVEIERATGMPLIWERADDRKMSKISIQNSNVSSETEADWPKMAQFQAEWSKRFYDILVPFITAK